MVQATLRKVGGSVMLALPPSFLEQLDLGARSTVAVALEGGRIVVEPQTRPRYTLAELLSQCDPSAPPSEEDVDWVTSGPVGDELI